MKLKRLELVGFKSFAQKTKLEFMPGIVAIVGPNGSGKSNITDAIRWILGEQSSSNLRSGKIQDLIFSGTPGRPPMGLAQVSMHFDNASGTLPIDYADVSISRKVNRDGSSEFYINDSSVRLKDIVDMLARARLGVRGIAVINQGASDVFLRATPSERREMIEEMLGLKEYRIKKKDAENKLSNTEANLSKARALLEEIQPHLRSLRRQTKRWEKRRDIEDDLRNLEREFFLRQLSRMKTTKQQLQQKRNALEQQLEEAKRELEEWKNKMESTEKAQPELLEKFNKLRAEKNDLDRKKGELSRELGKLEGRLEAVQETAKQREQIRKIKEFDVENAKRIIQKAHSALEQALSADSLQEVRSNLESLFADIKSFLYEKEEEPETEPDAPSRDSLHAELEKKHTSISASIDALNEKLAQLRNREEEASKQVQDANKEFQVVYRKQQERARRVSSIEHELGGVSVEEERVQVRFEDFMERIKDAGWELDQLKNILDSYEFQEFDFDIEERIRKYRRRLARIGEVDHEVIQEAEEIEERNSFLNEQIEDLEKAREDTTSLIVDLDKKIHEIFSASLNKINKEFQHFINLMFGGGRAKLELETKRKKSKSALSSLGSELGSEEEEEEETVDEADAGIEISVDLPRKKIKSIDMLSGGERSLVSIAALFSLVAVSPPPFLVLDEVDAALDEGNAKRFANLLQDLSEKTQFIIVTHNRVTMEAADALYGVTMGDDGVSKVLSLKLEKAEEYVR